MLTKVCVLNIKGAVGVRRAERSIIAILIVASRKDTLAMLAGGLGVGRLASTGVNLAPAGVGVDTGGKIVRRSIDQRSGATV